MQLQSPCTLNVAYVLDDITTAFWSWSLCAAVNVQNDSGDTPLHKAAYTGREDIVNLLIEYSADAKVRGHRTLWHRYGFMRMGFVRQRIPHMSLLSR